MSEQRTEDRYWDAECPKCGWAGLSRDCEGGDSIADTGDYTELVCPRCVHNGGKWNGDWIAVIEQQKGQK